MSPLAISFFLKGQSSPVLYSFHDTGIIDRSYSRTNISGSIIILLLLSRSKPFFAYSHLILLQWIWRRCLSLLLIIWGKRVRFCSLIKILSSFLICPDKVVQSISKLVLKKYLLFDYLIPDLGRLSRTQYITLCSFHD